MSSEHCQNIIHVYGTKSFSSNLKLLMEDKALLFKYFKYLILLFAFIVVLLFITCYINSKKESWLVSVLDKGIYGTTI